MNQQKLTVNEIFRLHSGEYLKKYHVSDYEKKIIRAIISCRTDKLGGRKEVCSVCGHTVILYNSCRNRHCPQCQFLKKEKWIMDKKNEVFPYQYFHAVFTLPDELNKIVFTNKKMIYKLLFDKVRDTVLNLSKDSKFLGADTGFFAIIHTWGQRLNFHPHIHAVIPGGGYSIKNHKWIRAKKDYFLPVEVLKEKFKYAFLTELKKMFKTGRINTFYDKSGFQKLVDKLFNKEWVVYIKETFNNPDSVIEYLAKYTHRIAISNHRIIKVEDGKIFFNYRDYKDNNKTKVHTLSALSFMRHFMLHIVPKRFTRIRYYGILSNRNKSGSLKKCYEYYKIKQIKKDSIKKWQDIYLKITGVDLGKCPLCRAGDMQINQIISISSKPPP